MSNYKRITEEDSKIIERMYEDGDKPSKIASTIGKTLRSVQRYIQLHISDELGEPWHPFHLHVNKSSNELERQEAVEAIILNDCSLTQDQIIDQLPPELKCSRTTLRRTMRALDITRKRLRKRPAERNKPETIRYRKVFASKVVRKKNSVLFYYDETGFNLHNGPSYGYAIKGVCPSIEVPGDRRRNVSVICCIGEQGYLDYMYVDGGFNYESLYEFMERLAPKIPRSSTLIMDNAQVHKSEPVKLLLAERGIEYLFLPPYTPQLNPIENFFSILKAKQARVRPRPKTRDDLKKSIDESFRQLRSYTFEGLYETMRKFLEIALRSEPFP